MANDRSHLTRYWAFGLLVLLIGGAMPVFDAASAQQTFQRRAIQRSNSPQGNDFAVAIRGSPPTSSALDTTSPLGQALAACEKDAVQDAFALPGPKGDVTLDRCYKGRAHFACVSAALVEQARSLTKSYGRIVEAKYPDLKSIEAICALKHDTLNNDITDSQEFIKQFALLKSRYEAASKCAASIEKSFQDLALTDLAQPSDVQKSMANAIESDFNKVSEVQNQIAALAAQMELSRKAMMALTKLHRALCVTERTAEQSRN